MSRSMKSLLLGLGIIAAIGAGFSAFTLNRGPRPKADVEVIARGEEVDLAIHVAPGKYTVFDFYAAWCPPCRTLSPALERLALAKKDQLAIRKVDIVDWTMPVTKQHGIESLPYLVLFDPQGQRSANGEKVFEVLLEVFGEAAREVTESTDLELQEAPLLGVETEDSKHVM